METETNYDFWKGKKVKLCIDRGGKLLFYTATIIFIDDNSVSFIDRTGTGFVYNKKDLSELHEIEVYTNGE